MAGPQLIEASPENAVATDERIRDDSEKWESIERYVEERSEAQFSHGYCPDCYEKYVRPQIEKR